LSPADNVPICFRCDFVASGLGMQKVHQGVFCVRNVLIFRHFDHHLVDREDPAMIQGTGTTGTTGTLQTQNGEEKQ
jgi:hypothetical protein